jgi:hypothetical protein
MSSPDDAHRPERVLYHESTGWSSDELWLCEPTGWEHAAGEWSLKCAHRDVNDHWARPGEVPGGDFLLRAVEIAYREERSDGERPFYTNAEILEHIERLLGLLRERI